MEHFKKIKKLNQQKAIKQYTSTLKRGKIKQSQSVHTQSFLKYSVIQKNYHYPSNQQSEPSKQISIQMKKRQDIDHNTLTIKNLDNNQIDVISIKQNQNYQDLVYKLYLQGIQQLPQIQTLLQKLWNEYLDQVQKQQEQFLQACYQGDINKVKKVVQSKGKHPIDPSLIKTIQGQNGIHLATVSGSYRNIQIITLLFNYKVDINECTIQQQKTPLILGSIQGNHLAVKALLQLGADPNLKDFQGNTALYYSCIYQHDNIVQLLLQKSCFLQLKNKKGQTALQCIRSFRIYQLFKGDPKYKNAIKQKIITSQQIIKLQNLFKEQKQNTQHTKSSSQSSSFKDKQIKLKVDIRKQKINHVSIKQIKQVSLQNFKKISLLGRGAFGQVFLVQNTLDSKRYAMKCLDKNFILKQNILRYAMIQKKILSTINHPFIVKLFFAFQTANKLILVMQYCPGGDLLRLIKRKGVIDQKSLQKYVCEIVLALQQLHKSQIIYRDLKPGNVVIDKEGHAMITDFGLSKQASLANSFCGSTAYLAPQMLWRRGHTKMLDWYLLGVLIYECLTGRPPFWNIHKQTLLNNIKSGKYKHLDKNQFSPQLVNFVDQLLRSNSTKRLGFKGSNQIKNHPWFKNINWSDVQARKLEMQIIQESPIRPIRQQSIQQPVSFQENKIQGWQYASQK